MGRRIRKLVVALATAMVATTALVVGAAPAAHAAEGCTYNSPITVYARYVVPPTRVELRANSNQVCAWGRITSAAVGDLVWVDRSYNGGQTWEQLGITAVTSGTSNFTPAYNDQGKVMRACAALALAGGGYGYVTCTGWW